MLPSLHQTLLSLRKTRANLQLCLRPEGTPVSLQLCPRRVVTLVNLPLCPRRVENPVNLQLCPRQEGTLVNLVVVLAELLLRGSSAVALTLPAQPNVLRGPALR